VFAPDHKLRFAFLVAPIPTGLFDRTADLTAALLTAPRKHDGIRHARSVCVRDWMSTNHPFATVHKTVLLSLLAGLAQKKSLGGCPTADALTSCDTGVTPAGGMP